MTLRPEYSLGHSWIRPRRRRVDAAI